MTSQMVPPRFPGFFPAFPAGRCRRIRRRRSPRRRIGTMLARCWSPCTVIRMSWRARRSSPGLPPPRRCIPGPVASGERSLNCKPTWSILFRWRRGPVGHHSTQAHSCGPCQLGFRMVDRRQAYPVVASDMIMPPTLMRSSGRRLILSTRKVATRMKQIVKKPTATVASSLTFSSFMPAFRRFSGCRGWWRQCWRPVGRSECRRWR